MADDLTDAQRRLLANAYKARNGSTIVKITSRTASVARALERKGLGYRQMDYFIAGEWLPMSEAPLDGSTIRAEIRGHGCGHQIAWVEGIGVTDDDQPCGAWVHKGPGEPPPSWSDGACWDSNADGGMSAPPVRWFKPMELPHDR